MAPCAASRRKVARGGVGAEGQQNYGGDTYAGFDPRNPKLPPER